MSNLAKFCLFLSILFCFFSCSQVIDNSFRGSGDVSFSFRAGESVSGGELIVTVEDSSGKKIDEQHQLINSQENIVLKFSSLPAGEDYKFIALIIKDGVELYRGSKNHVVTKGDNSVKLQVDAVNIRINFLADSTVPYASLDGAILEVTVDGKKLEPVLIKSSDQSVSVNGGYFSVGKKITVDATIAKPDISGGVSSVDGSELVYASSQVYNVVVSGNTVTFNFEPYKGCFLWKSTKQNEFGQPSTAFSYDIAKNKNLENYSFDKVTGNRPTQSKSGGLLDYCIDSNDLVWTLTKTAQMPLTPKVSCWKSGEVSFKTHQPNVKIATAITAYSNGGILISGVNESSSSDPLEPPLRELIFVALSANPDTGDIKSGTAPKVSYELGNEKIGAMVMSENDIYLANTVPVSKEDPDNTNIKIVQFNISGDTANFVSEKVYTSANMKISSGYVTDMIIGDDGYLYISVIDNKSNINGDVSRGALLKINISTLEFVDVLGLNPENYVRDEAGARKYFVGPRKFVANRSGKLVIADSGALKVTDDASSLILKKRILTVNLNNFKIETIENLGDDMLDGATGPGGAGSYDRQFVNR